MSNMRFVTRKEMQEAVERVGGGWKHIADRPISDNPGDWYLKIVLAERDYIGDTKEYVTWIYNATMHSLNEGYYTLDKAQAEEDFRTRR